MMQYPSEPAAVILTRPAGRNAYLAQQLALHGVTSLSLPALVLTPTNHPAPLPQSFDLILFVSGFAVQTWLRSVGNIPWPAGLRVTGVGQGTLHALRGSGVVPENALIFPDPAGLQDSEALWRTLCGKRVHPRRVLIVRGDTGRDWLRQQWQQAGVVVQDFIAYRRRAAVWSVAQGERVAQLASRHSPCVLLVSSTDGARAIDDNVQRLGLTCLWQKAQIVTLHPRIAQCVVQWQGGAGTPPVVTRPDAQAMLNTLLALARGAE